MKKATLFLLFCWLQFNCEAQVNARVMRVKDGDTFVLLHQGNFVTVRLNNVDAPELKQHFGIEAMRAVSGLILYQNVEFESKGSDKYGRRLGNIKLRGQRLDSLLIRKGYAWQYINYSNDRMLANEMNISIRERAGLWICGKETVCPPWIFRGYNTRNRIIYCSGCNQNSKQLK